MAPINVRLGFPTVSYYICFVKLGACLNRCLMRRLPRAALSALAAGRLARGAHARRVGRHLPAQLVRVLALRRRGRALLHIGIVHGREGLDTALRSS